MGPFHHCLNTEQCRIRSLPPARVLQSTSPFSNQRGCWAKRSDEDPTYLSGMFNRAAKGSQKPLTLKTEAETIQITEMLSWGTRDKYNYKPVYSYRSVNFSFAFCNSFGSIWQSINCELANKSIQELKWGQMGINQSRLDISSTYRVIVMTFIFSLTSGLRYSTGLYVLILPLYQVYSVKSMGFQHRSGKAKIVADLLLEMLALPSPEHHTLLILMPTYFNISKIVYSEFFFLSLFQAHKRHS